MIRDIFKKDIGRKIEGVIKADILDDESVFNEVDEYVVTDELNKKFDTFFDTYANTIGKPTQSIGVWISGFFGSGKSHLLKILSYILSSRSVHSDIIGELFLEKIDKSDFELIGNIKKALSIKADTLLFNIDTKADSGAGNRAQNAILQVFLKVFNEHRGYYPKQPSIANFEKNLDRKGKYQEFKDAFEKINGNSWIQERDALTFVIDDAAKAFSEVQNISYESAIEQLNKLDETFTISIEDFAKEVKEYIATKEPNYRLIFLVDEVGQFIGENTAVMLNLQSMVESLATICQGQAWVIVTSQSAIKNLISSHDGLENDFSKIMGRFDVKLDLTSQNANEVIQKRLLSKKESAVPQLSSLYNAHQNSIKSIIHFSDRGIQYKNYSNDDEFVSTYPFIPYQLDLFQRCIIGLSNNEMFQGKHASIGERSMLNVVQKVALDISYKEVGALASFDYFFDGISNIIRPELQTQITLAKNSLDHFTIKVLKTLFLVKYVDGFSSNIENITTLLVDSLDVNITELTQKVKNSLSTLLSQVYIQKVGDIYEFLTNAEKDIENEIKRVDISDVDTSKELADWIYDDIIKITKVRYEGNKHDYAFTRKLDSVKVKGNDEELMLNIITPLNNEEYTDNKLIHKSMAENDVIINLGQDFEFIQDLRIYIQTKKFIPLRQSGNLTDQERYILQTKGTDNQKRKKELIEKLKQKFEDASLYFNGSNLPKNTTDVRKIIENAFNEVIPTIYTNIGMLNAEYNEKQIDVIIDGATDLFGKEDSVLDPASEEMHSFLKRAKSSSQSVTIQELIHKYTKKPYGWYQAGIQCIIAKLFARDLITITLNGTIQDAQNVKSTLTNSRNFHALVKLSTAVDEKEIKKAKEILKDLFPETSFTNMNATALVENVKKLSQERISKLQNYANLNYPFASKLSNFFLPYEELIDSNIETFFEILKTNEGRLLDEYEDDIAKILDFMEHGQRSIYDDLQRFLQDNRANIRHFNHAKVDELQKILEDANIYKNNKLPYANTLKAQIQDEFTPLLAEIKESAIKQLEVVITTLQNDANFEKVPTEERYKVIRPIQEIESQIKNSSIIDSITAMANDSSLLTRGLEAIEELMVVDEGEAAVVVQRVQLTSIMPKGKRLHTSDDVESYLAELKKELLQAIEQDKEILV
jgi:hypothetical protein